MAQELDLNNLTEQQKKDIIWAYREVPQQTNRPDGTSQYGAPGQGNADQYARSWDQMSPQEQQRIASIAMQNPNFASSYSIVGVSPSANGDPNSPRAQPGLRVQNSIDPNAYALDAQGQADISTIRDVANSVYGRDATRFDVDPYAIPGVEGYSYDPATASIYTTDASQVFDPTREQLGYANDMLGYAMDINGTPLGQAAELQYLAATGQAPSAADLALNRDANALFAQQMAMAARARGSASSGLATMNAQNNAALGYAQLVNAADVARANEMAMARSALGQTGLGIRQGDLAGAQQAAQNANQLYSVNNSELQAMQNNTAAMNQGSQYNTAITNDAAKYGAGAMQAASGANMQGTMDLLTGNANRGATVGSADDALGADYANTLVTVGENDRGSAITREQNIQQTNENIQTLDNNYGLGVGSTQAQLTGQREAAQAQRDAAVIGAIGTGLGGIASMAAGGPSPPSDKRVKDIGGRASPADFSSVEPYEWEYEDSYDGAPGTQWTGGGPMKSGMAQDFPDEVVETGPDGVLRVNPLKAMMRYADSIGDLQRRIKKVEAK